MQIAGKPAAERWVLPDLMSAYYELDGRLYLLSVWNRSAAYYDVLIALTDAESRRCRADEAYRTRLATRAVNNPDLRGRLVADYRLMD